MPLGTDYHKLNRIFDPTYGTGGVLFPFWLPAPVALGTASTLLLSDYQFPFKVRLMTAQAFPAANVTAVAASTTMTLDFPKTTASVEPVIAVAVGTAGVASEGLATEVSTITCSGVGTRQVWWAGSTTETDIDTTQSLWVYVKTAAAEGSYPSTGQDGLVKVCLWLAVLNGPA